METRTEIIDGQEVTIKTYATRKYDRRKTRDRLSRSRARKWERRRERDLKAPKIDQLFNPRTVTDLESHSETP